MATAQLGTLLRHIHRLAADRSRQGTDRQLLDEFTARRDEAAFTALVARHGPMVLRVCRRVLHHEQDAEDAFQATFLVLAQNTRSIHKREALAGWLHGVAYRTAMKAKRSAARRRNHEARLRALTPPTTARPTWDDVQAVLDEEIERLPHSYRAAFVLCVLEGKSRQEAAAELGCQEGTVWSRLTRARQQLQHALARRGIQLAALLAALSVAESAGRAALPATLAHAAVRFGLLVAAGNPAAGVIPSHVAALAAGVSRAMFLTKARIATAVLLAVGLVAGAGALARHALAAGAQPMGSQQPAPAAAKEAGKERAAADSDDRVEVRGRVLDPDGKPLAGATLSVWSGVAKKEAPRARETTGKDGRFRIMVRRSDLQDRAILVASGAGHGPDWTELPRSIPAGREVTLRLIKDSVPIEGRILDLEGRPVPDVTVEVQRLGKVAGRGDLGAWIDRNVDLRKKGRYLNEEGLDVLPAEAAGLRLSVKTGRDGRFRLSGFGRDRVVRLYVRGETIEFLFLWSVTRPGPKQGWITGSFPLYAASFDRLVAPCKPIVGTVRDRATGKPLAGITVEGGPGMYVRTSTDARGRYRLIGVPKRQQGYWMTAGGGKGKPYFDLTQHNIADTPGLEPITVDFELERGIEITGRVTEQATGKPVRGRVMYFYPADNPNLKDFTSLTLARVLVSDWGRISPDGSFAELAIPGPGVLVVCADDETGFPILNAQTKLSELGVRHFPAAPAHAVLPIKVSEDDPKSLKYDIALQRGRQRSGSVLGPDGKELAGTRVAGLTVNGQPEKLDTARFTMRGLGEDNQYLLIFLHDEKKLGAVVEVHAREEKPIVAPLQPLGALRGQVMDGDGQPLAGKHVVALMVVQGRQYQNLPLEVLNVAGVFGAAPGPWYAFTSCRARVGKDGRFRLEGLVAGAKYRLAVAEDDRPGSPLHYLENDPVTVEAGKVKDLGRLKPKSAPDR
jgi:RNA polymerase sigma factor (sigma-70 family)